MQKNILVIENNPKHLESTLSVLQSNELSSIFHVIHKCFPFLDQNRADRDQQKDKIINYINSECNSKQIDILMIDMLLGGDNAHDPLGLEILNIVKSHGKITCFIAQTQLIGSQVDILKNNNVKNIILKPGDTHAKYDERPITCVKYEDRCCENTTGYCTYIKNFICEMKRIYNEMKGTI